MAIIKRGILGGVQNKIGNVVGSSWKGIATLRSLPLSVSNPKTAAQTSQRNRFSKAAKLGSSVLATIVKPLNDRFAQQESGYNVFVKRALTAINSENEILYPNLVISQGSLAASAISSVTASASTDTMTVNWDTTPEGDANATDKAYVMVMNKTTGLPAGVGFITDTPRDEGTTTLVFAGLTSTDEYAVYLAFRKADGSKVSDTTYSSVVVGA